MKPVVLLFSVILLLLSSVWESAYAGNTFSPGSVQEWLRQQENSSKELLGVDGRKRLFRLVSTASSFRESAAQNLEQAVEEHNGNRQGFTAYIESEMAKEIPQIWSYVYAGSVLFVGNINSNHPITVYYNPYIDAAALVQWDITDGNEPYTPAGMTAFIPSVFTSDAKQDQIVPWWLADDDRRTPVALKEQYEKFSSWFSEHWPLNCSDEPEKLPEKYSRSKSLEIIEKRSTHALIAISNLLKGPDWAGTRNSLSNFRKVLAEGDVKNLRSAITYSQISHPAAIASLPERFRIDLLPVYVQSSEAHCLIYLQVRHSPRFFYAIDFSKDNTPKALSALFIDYETESSTP